MKKTYLIPTTLVTRIAMESLLVSVSGGGLHDGGTDDGSHTPQAPGRKMF